jgi:hypothetical protein
MKATFALLALGTALSVGAIAAPAQAVLPVVLAPCANTDITPTAEACLGFYGDQLLSGSPGDVAVQIEALGDLGFVWDGTTVVENLTGLGGSDPTFVTSLNGTTWLGIHWGGGTGSPVPGQDSTSFYRFDAGTDLHTILLAYNSSSDAKLYFTGDNENPGGGPVPEPATWALMLVGFGGMGAVLRRNRRHARAFA